MEENVKPSNKWSGLYLMGAILLLLILAKVLLG